MKVEIKHSCADYNSFRAAKVKSLFNAETGYTWSHTAELPIEDDDWSIGLVVGPSGSGKSSIGKAVFAGDAIHDLYAGWPADSPIIDAIAPTGDFKQVTGALASVGLGDVPAWLRPFPVLSNGEQFRAGLARLVVDAPSDIVVDEFTSVIDRQIAKIGAAGTLTADTLPPHIDLGITAHSWDYVGKKTRYATRLGWIGYHPSLLPRHRGKSAVEWAIRMGDAVTGGSVFWLNAGIDRGDVERQDWCFVDPALRVGCPKKAAKKLWREELLPMGVRLLEGAVRDIASGVINRRPQNARFGTFEPGTDIKDLYRPDLLMLPEVAESAV